MFEFFKKKPVVHPSFNYIKNHPLRDKYFVRLLCWDWLDDKMIHLFDNKAPRFITMDEWPQEIFLAADGQKTIEEYIYWMANLYLPNPIPSSLDKDIISVIEGMIKDGDYIGIRDNKTSLPYYLAQPNSALDKEKAMKLMILDGYIEG
jgi:hypothetical protein